MICMSASRRSSCRKRRKTDFYVSTPPAGADNDEGGEVRRGREKREKAAEPVRRKLFPGESVTPLVVSPPDTSGTAVVHIVEREDGPSETECPNDLVVSANKKGKEVTFVSMFVHTYMYVQHVQCM